MPVRRPAGSPKRRRITWLVALALLGAACGGGMPSPSPIVQPPPLQPEPPSPPPPPPPTLGVTRILAFGDSMTAGTTSPPLAGQGLTAGLPQSYPFKLQDLLAARYTAQTIVVLNAGQPGEQATAGQKRFGSAVSEAKPDVILLMQGANDLNAARDQQVNAAITAAVSALEEMVKEADRRRIPVMVATLPPQRPPKGAPANYLARLNDAIKVMAAKKGGILVDVNALVPEPLIGQDGLHPTESGYQRIAEVFADALRTKYEGPAAPAR